MSSSTFKVGDSLIVKEKGGLGKENMDVMCNYSCWLCDKIYQKRNSYNYHMRTKHSGAKVPAKPTNMKKVIPSKQVMKENNQTDNYQCGHCEKSYKFASSLTKHVQKHHAVNQSSGKKKVKATLRENRSALGTLGRSFRCDLCPQVFNSQERKNAHFQAVHLPLIKEVYAKNKNKKATEVSLKLKCKMCQKKFMFQKSLIVHIKTHSDKLQEVSLLVANVNTDQIYVDGETLEPIVKDKKHVFNPNIDRRKVIHLHAETHRLDDLDDVVVATNDIEEEFRMDDFDEATNQHYVCKPSHADDSVYMGNKDAHFPPEIVQSCMKMLTASSEVDSSEQGGCVLQLSPLFIFQEVIPVEQNLNRDNKSEAREMIIEVIEDLLDNVQDILFSVSKKSDEFVGGAEDDKDDAGIEADCSNMDTTSDSSDEASTRPNTHNMMNRTSCYFKTISEMKIPSRNSHNPAKAFSALKKSICPSPRVTSSPLVTSPIVTSSSSEKVSPLITGVGDCPRGKLLPMKQHSPPEATCYKPTSQQHQTPPLRGIHPLLLPLYTQSPPPILPTINTSHRNMDNLISVFIHGRDSRKDGGNSGSDGGMND